MKILCHRLKVLEPVYLEGIAKAVVAIVIGWPLVALTDARQGLLLGLYAAVAAPLVRSQVTPNAKVDGIVEDAVRAKQVEIHDFLNGLGGRVAKARK